MQTSMREANDRGYDCLLVEDATESCFPEFKAAALEMIAAQGAIVGWHAPSGTVLGAIDKGRAGQTINRGSVQAAGPSRAGPERWCRSLWGDADQSND